MSGVGRAEANGTRRPNKSRGALALGPSGYNGCCALRPEVLQAPQSAQYGGREGGRGEERREMPGALGFLGLERWAQRVPRAAAWDGGS